MITIINGTNRANNLTSHISNHYRQSLENQKLDLPIDFIDLSELPPNFIENELYGKRSINFAPIETTMKTTQFFIFVLPEYNGSYPGVLKVFIDAFVPAEVFHNKTAALVGLSSGKFGNLRGLEHLTGVLNYLQVQVLPYKVHIPYIEQKLSVEGQIIHQDTIHEINKQIILIEKTLALQNKPLFV